MKFTKDALVDGTSRRGVIKASFDDLQRVFGEPDIGPNQKLFDKVTCEWDLEFEDGTVATIYDWKEPETPFHEYDWHIGGKSFDAVERIYEAMGR